MIGIELWQDGNHETTTEPLQIIFTGNSKSKPKGPSDRKK